MIIECINCNKIFEVNSQLIPLNGRTIQCGACNHVWFYNPNQKVKNVKTFKNNIKTKVSSSNNKVLKKEKKPEVAIDSNDEELNKKIHPLIKYSKKPSFTFGKFLNYILILILSFIALIISLDTFKTPLESIFPNLELFLYNLFETIKDLLLFFNDLK